MPQPVMQAAQLWHAKLHQEGIAECIRQGLPPGEHQSIWLSNAGPCLGMVSRWVLEVVHLVNTEFAPCKSGWHAIRETRTPLLDMQHSFVRIVCASFGRLIFLTWVKPSVASMTHRMGSDVFTVVRETSMALQGSCSRCGTSLEGVCGGENP